ncbi:MAG: tRNA preQ1(34) S-adenosylmethionine ribosyltransferase-isomerase QueA [Myxococcales bacterium]|nr:tRNA preQ1(34) S-adenosylmethionine ribosyltransferase-isomerase QueA [Myxococcales bacterium]
MRIDLFDFHLPEGLVADHPAAERDGARLLVVKPGAALEDRAVLELPALLPEGALVVVNDTRVIPARLFGTKPSGGRVEVLLLEREAGGDMDEVWRALGRSSKPIRAGATLALEGDISALVLEVLADGSLRVRLGCEREPVAEAIDRAGHVPLPPYIRRQDEPEDRSRYQTVYARERGAVAAPTAGLHLSERLIGALRERGIVMASVTLHVSLGTFQPVKVDDLDDHPMHEETYAVPEETVRAIAAARARGAPVVAIGTTTVRALESAAIAGGGEIAARAGRTRLLIQPGFSFRVVDVLLTNFHLPRSTLLAMVSAFGGRERVLEAYAHAVGSSYRFFSYGDAMLLWRGEAS